MENKLSQRKGIRLKNYDYSNNGMYFVTICTKNKIKMLSEIINNTTVGNDALVVPSTIGEIVNECWNNIQTKNKNVYINEYIIMPNHIHGIIEITNQREMQLCIEKKYGFETVENQERIYNNNGLAIVERRGRRSLQNIIKDFKSVTTRRYNTMVNEKYKNLVLPFKEILEIFFILL